jgi:uncharacterized membrane protein YkvA (DUF1232 family)
MGFSLLYLPGLKKWRSTMIKAKMFGTLKNKARDVKKKVFILYLACRDPRVPWYAKAFTLLVVAYVFSPVDLIPDFIPVIGCLDDLLLVPLGISIAIKMIPEPVLRDYRKQAEAVQKNDRPTNWAAGILFIAIWILLALWFGKLLYRMIVH